MSDYFKKRMEELGIKSTTPSTNSSDKSTITQDKNKGSGYFTQRAEELELNKDKTDDYGIKKWFTDTESTLKEMSSYYETSANKFTTDFGGTTSKRVKELLDSSKDVYDYLHNHKGEISNFEDMEKALSEYRSALMQFDYSNTKYQKHYSQFESEEQYNDAMKINELYGMSSEEIAPYVNTYSEDIANLDAQRNALKKKINRYNRGDRTAFRTYEEKKEAEEQLKKYEKQIDALQNKSKESSIAYTTMGGQNITWQSLYDEAKDREEFEALYSSVSGNADFNKAVQSGINYRNPDIRTAEKGKTPVNKVKYVEENYAYIGAGELNGGGSNIVHSRIGLMTDEEKNIYHYYFGRGEFDKADEYLNSLDSKLKTRYKNQEIESFKKLANDMPVTSSLISVFTSMASGAETVKNGLNWLVTGETERNHLSDITSAIRGTVSEKVNWEIGNWDAFDFVYNSSMSMADSVASSALFGNLGGTVLGLSAAGQGTNAALDRGMTGDTAFFAGFTSGIFEGLFETWSLGKLQAFKDVPGDTFKAFAKNLGSAMLTNASEEGLTELANITYDLVVNGAFSQAETSARMYMAAGMSAEDAKNKVIWELVGQVVESTASGAFMGLGMGGGAQAVGYYNNTKATGQNIIDNKGYDDLKALAVSVSEEASGIKGIDKAVAKADKKTSAWNVGKLSQAVDSVRGQQNVADVKTALVDGGMDERQAQSTAERIITIAEKNASGADLTKAEYKFITKDSATYNAYSSLLSNPDSTVHSRNTQHINARNGIIKGEDGSETLSEGAESRVNERAAQIVALDNIASNSRYKANTGIADEGEEGEFPVTAEEAAEHKGKTTYTNPETGETKVVEVRGISSIKDGEMTLKLDNGDTVNSEDVRFSSEGEAIVYSTILDMGVDAGTAEALVNEFKASGVDGGTYALGIKDVYTFGKMNFDLKHLPENSFSRQLSEAQRSYIHKLGANAATAEATARQKSNDTTVKNGKKVKGGQKFGNIIAEDGVATTARGEIIEDGLNDLQKKSLLGIKALAKVSPINFHIFQSEMVDGKFVAKINGEVVEGSPNGVYFSGTNDIWIDLNAGDFVKGDIQGTMLWTASHEISHYIRERSPVKWKAMADYLIEELSKNKDVPITELLDRQKAKIAKRTSTKTEAEVTDEAYEELVSDALSDMLTDGTVVNFLADLKQKDKSLWQSIKDAIADLLKRWGEVLGVYKGRTPDAAEAQALRGMEKAYKKLQQMYAEAFAEANEVEVARQTIGARNLEDFSAAQNTNGESLFQYRAMEADEDTYKDMLRKWGKMTDAQINNLFSTIDKAMDIIKDNLEVLDYAWEADIDDRAFSPVKPNSDSLYKVSLDFSTLCRKRILQQTIVAELQAALEKPLTREEGIAIRDALIALQEEGRKIEVACALCYVESARMKSPKQIEKWLKNREAVLREFFASKSGGSIKDKVAKAETDIRERLHREHPDGIKSKDGETMLDPRNATLKELPKKYADAIRQAKKDAKVSYIPTEAEQNLIEVAKGMTVSDFTSPEGLENLAKYYSDLFDAYTSFVRNATKSKGIENDTWWRAGDSLKIGDVLIANMNKENGLRSQSWSDFQVIHILDYIAATIELSTRNAKEQAYSKVPDYVELMGQTGVMINMSLIPTREFNGKLEYDEVEGIAYKRALELRDKYPATAGTICIGINNQQIKMLLADINIDYVIPYHRSGMAASIRKLMHIPSWDEFEKYQGETALSDADAQKNAKKYGVKLLDKSDPNYHKHTSFSEWFDLEVARQIAQMENANPSDSKKKEAYGVMYGGYMAMQDAANRYLKLCAERGLAPKFSHEKADFTTEDNYWKLLIDRKMVNNVTGEIIEQQTIKPIFDEGEVLRILNDELDRYPGVKADQDYAVRKVTENFLSGNIKSGMSAEAIAKVMKKPVDNVTAVNIEASAEDVRAENKPAKKLSARNTDSLTKADVEKSFELVWDGIVKATNGAYKDVKDFLQNETDYEMVDYWSAMYDTLDEDVLDANPFDRVEGLWSDGSDNWEQKWTLGDILEAYQNGSLDKFKYRLKVEAQDEAKPKTWREEAETYYTEIYNQLNDNLKKKMPSFEELIAFDWEKSNKSESPHLNVIMTIQQEPDRDKRHKLYSMSYNMQDLLKHHRIVVDYTKYSERNTDSNRSLLANALETTVQNEAEANKLKEYKKKIDLIDAEQKKLAEINAEIRELSFGKGKRDTERLKSLRFDAAQTANRINTYDRQLLNLESTKVLKRVLEREKGLARKRQKQENAEILADYRARHEAEMKAIRQQNAESRRKATEGRHKTVMKHKIRGVISELNTLFIRGNKEKNVKKGLHETVATAIASAELLFSDEITNEMIVKHGFSLPLSDKENTYATEYVERLKEISEYEEALAKLKDSDDIGKEQKRREYLDKMWEHKRKLKGLDKKLSDAFERERIAYNRVTTETILKELASAYGKIQNADEDYLRASYDDSIRQHIENLAEYLSDEPTVRDMSYDSLQKVYKAYKMVLTAVKKANTSFKADKAMSISALANNTMGEVEAVGGSKTHVLGGKIGDAVSAVKSFDFNNLKPVHFFKKIGSGTLSMLFENVRKGEDTWAVDITEAKEFKETVADKYGYKKWDFKKPYTFTSATGREFTLTLEQIMSLYAYSKRDQALPHLAEGGFVFDQAIETYKEKDGKKSILKYRVNTATAYKVSESEVAGIIGGLTKEQKDFVDEMQDYLSSVMGAKGNEVSMEMYGVDLFTEKFYFPLKSAKQYMFEQNEVAGEVKIKNSSFSKETKRHANNPVILSNFMDVWASHVNDMSMYHAFVLPLEDFNRVFNYSTPASEGYDSESVKGFIQNAYGVQANQYISQLLKDLNGGARVDPRESAGKKMVGAFKKAKVFGSVSVIVQQPSAVARALAEINAKYFDFNPKLISHKKHWEELKKYAPVAIIKEMGHFDTDMGMSTTDYIRGDKTVMGVVDNIVSKPAAYMDELTWVHIWTAVKRETMAKNKGLTGEALLRKSGERFTEVVTKTQVYDSVLARSANMRSKSMFMNMITSFMAEPTTSINMVEGAITDFKRGKKGKASGTIASVAASVVLNSLLVSLVYGARDDDEDETYLEKYLGSFATEVADGLNPITYYPILKDIWSIMQGYEVKRTDMTLIDDMVSSLKDAITILSKDTEDMSEEELAEYKKDVISMWHSVAGKASSLVGLPVDNLIRDVKAVFNVVDIAKRGQKTSPSLIWDRVTEDIKSSLPIVGWLPKESKQDKLYDAIVSGDTAYIARLKSGYKDEVSYTNAVVKALRENDSRIKEAAEARVNGDMTGYKAIALEIKREGHFSQDMIVRAINSEMNALTKGESTSGTAEKPMYTSADYYKAALGGDSADVNTVKQYLIESGKKESSIESTFNTSVKDAYEKGEINSMKAVSLMVEYGGKTSEEANLSVKYVDFKTHYPSYADNVTEAKYEKYFEPNPDYHGYSLDDMGIGIGEYAEYCERTVGVKGTDNDGDGKADSGTKKAKIMDIIDSLSLTSAQKDALYYLNGWSSKTIYEAPWH